MASPFFLVWTLSALINKERLRLFFLAFIIQQKPRGLESYLSFFHLATSKRTSQREKKSTPTTSRPHRYHNSGTTSYSNSLACVTSTCMTHTVWVIQYDTSSSSLHPFFNEEYFEHLEDENKLSFKEHWFSLFSLSGDSPGKQVPLLVACQLIDPIILAQFNCTPSHGMTHTVWLIGRVGKLLLTLVA